MENIIYNTKMNVTNYVAVINRIADGYFDIDGTYQPEYGLINAMRIFYNLCVTGGKFEEEFSHDIVDVLDIGKIICDDDFCLAFNEAIKSDGYSINFANAFNTALDIVNYRKSDVGSLFESVKTLVLSLTKNLNDVMTEENIKYMSEIGKDILSGKNGVESIVDVYKKELEEKQKE